MFDDFTDEPQGTPKAAVVRRQGESRGQMQDRHAGYTDEQTGYGQGRSLLARSYGRASGDNGTQERFDARQTATQNRFDTRMSMAERAMALREQQASVQERIHTSAQEDKKAALDQFGGFMQEEDALAQKYGRYTQPFLAGVLSMAKKYPAAVMADPRLGAKLNHYGETFQQNGGHPDLPTALWEAAQFDPTTLPPDQARQYIGQIVSKYPGVAGDKAFSSLLEDKAKQVAAREAKMGAPDELKQKVAEAEALSAAHAKGTASVKPSEPDSYEKWNKEIASARIAHGGTGQNTDFLPPDVLKGFTDRAAALDAANVKKTPLDVTGAKKLLEEAGGDKDKARALAKERGFHF